MALLELEEELVDALVVDEVVDVELLDDEVELASGGGPPGPPIPPGPPMPPSGGFGMLLAS